VAAQGKVAPCIRAGVALGQSLAGLRAMAPDRLKRCCGIGKQPLI